MNVKYRLQTPVQFHYASNLALTFVNQLNYLTRKV